MNEYVCTDLKSTLLEKYDYIIQLLNTHINDNIYQHIYSINNEHDEHDAHITYEINKLKLLHDQTEQSKNNIYYIYNTIKNSIEVFKLYNDSDLYNNEVNNYNYLRINIHDYIKIPKFYNAIELNTGLYCIIIEYISGVLLSSYTFLNPEHVTKIYNKIYHLNSYLNDMNICHVDLHKYNILIKSKINDKTLQESEELEDIYFIDYELSIILNEDNEIIDDIYKKAYNVYLNIDDNKLLSDLDTFLYSCSVVKGRLYMTMINDLYKFRKDYTLKYIKNLIKSYNITYNNDFFKYVSKY